MKHYTTSYRKWVGFAELSDYGDFILDPNYTRAVFDMSSVFDRMGEGVLCIIEVQKDTGGLVLSFDKPSLRFLKQYHIDVEQWLNAAYNYILRCDVFTVLDEDGNIDPINNEKDFYLIDSKGRMTWDKM